jgi:hypothetical protein
MSFICNATLSVDCWPGTFFSYDKMRPTVDLQLEKAGIRLAYILN